jgi:hypothetical protein
MLFLSRFGKLEIQNQNRLKKSRNLSMILIEFCRVLLFRRGTMKNPFKKKSDSPQKKKASLYRIPETVWMSDVKKASEWGALLPKKGPFKKAPTF